MTRNNYGITNSTIITDELVLSICLRDGDKMKSVVSSDKWQRDHLLLTDYILNKYPDADNISECLYRMKYHIDVRPVCPICGGRVKFIKFKNGFPRCCSTACLNKDPEHIKKVKETCQQRYGGNNPMCSKLVKDKSKQTCLKKYGVEFSLQAESIREKSKQTCLEKYGKQFYGQFGSDEYKELIKSKYGVDNPFQAEFVKEKMKETNLRKYGVEYVSQSKEIMSKARRTCIERYGAPTILQTQDGKERVKKTVIERYGVEYAVQSPIIKNRIKERCIQKYGVEYVSQAPEVKEKFKQTCLERYGVEHVLQNPIYNNKVLDTKRKNHTWNTSKLEEDFANYLIQKYSIERLYKSELYPFNCDFYIKELDVYIELQGTWTHGKHRYNPEDPKDIEKLQFWQLKNTPFYISAIQTWTVRDPLKFETAEKNNLKYLTIYSCKLQECINQFEKFIETLQ